MYEIVHCDLRYRIVISKLYCIYIAFVSLKILLNLANSADPDEKSSSGHRYPERKGLTKEMQQNQSL